MGDVVPFRRRHIAPPPSGGVRTTNDLPIDGDQAFLFCPCDQVEPVPFVPVVTIGPPSFVVALVCPACERHLSVTDGAVR